MAHRRLNSAISRLDTTRKLILISTVLVGISAVLPWYEDLDAFGAGDLYLGVTGPLFLVGLMVLASAAFVSYWVLAPTLGRRLPALPIKEGALFAFLGIQDLVLLLVANSVFFHPKFGVNITLKNTKFGMIIAAAGVLLLIWSGYRLYKQEEKRRSSISPEGRLEPLIKMPTPETTRAPRRAPVERVERDRDPSHYAGKSTISSYTQGPVERSIDSLNREVLEARETTPAPRKEPNESGSADAGPQPLRMDL
jgi:hypothetical protein